MKDYYNISIDEDCISISLYIEYEEVTKLGEAMEQANYADESLAANRDSVKMKIEEITALRFKQIADEEYQKVLKDVGGAVG